MAESRLRAPDLAAQLGVARCQGKCQKSSPDAGRQPLSGKSFYLDLPAGKNLQFLTGAIQQLGGVIEGFLSKEVSYIVSSRREAKAESGGTSHRGCPSPGEVRRILHVDEMMVHVQQLSLEALRVRKHGPQKPEGTCPAESRTRKGQYDSFSSSNCHPTLPKRFPTTPSVAASAHFSAAGSKSRLCGPVRFPGPGPRRAVGEGPP
uniref:BRCT domain-containing protein n=1 Tax=Sus scrofa TaxID=9823 RepID=A0A8D1HED5_PIG